MHSSEEKTELRGVPCLEWVFVFSSQSKNRVHKFGPLYILFIYIFFLLHLKSILSVKKSHGKGKIWHGKLDFLTEEDC